MSNSICKFMPEKNYNDNLKFIHFVYETDFHSLKQPFFHSTFRIHLVTKGTASIKINDRQHNLNIGSVFFAFPSNLYEFSASDDFEYYYISFLGNKAPKLLEEFGVNISAPVYHGLEMLIDFWNNSIKKIDMNNINVLTEAVFLYTLSFIKNSDNNAPKHDNTFEKFIDYVDNHYRDFDISLQKVADTFSYTEKYLSHLFKKNMNISFKTYINDLRIQYAYILIENGETSITDIARLCGYSDSHYFSKVFKKIRGISPTEYIKKHK